LIFFFSRRRRHTRFTRDWSSDVCSSDLTLMLADEHPEHGILSPLAHGGTGMRMHLHVDDVDALARRAWDAGATILMAPADQAHGERQCRLRDPFGHEWLLGHPVEDVPLEEVRRRIAAAAG